LATLAASWGLRTLSSASRKKAPPGGRKQREPERRKARPIETRETGRWIDGLRAADRLLGGAAMVTVIADCESDIYEEICDAPLGSCPFARARGVQSSLDQWRQTLCGHGGHAGFCGAGDRHSRQAGPARARGANPRELWRKSKLRDRVGVMIPKDFRLASNCARFAWKRSIRP